MTAALILFVVGVVTLVAVAAWMIAPAPVTAGIGGVYAGGFWLGYTARRR